MIENSFESDEMTQLHKIVSNHDKNARCCEYLEVAVRMNKGSYYSMIMERVSSNEYKGYAQWFREEFCPKVDEKPDLRNSLVTIFLYDFWELSFTQLKTAKDSKFTIIVLNLFVAITKLLFVRK